ncbi:transposase [Marinoscillum pacificum]|uniref:transposase n=1 Tax=Marinoscillum pacificum TaxID=392723 RepID=UPI0021570F88|nr:transposase [Marinoscillum pacificum]
MSFSTNTINLAYQNIEERELPENTAQHVLKDEVIELSNPTSKHKYPKQLRRIAVWDDENKQTIELITNNLKWAAQTIADLYKARWEIEVFFRDIKQLLHIKTFIGTSKNAVMIQIWTALITILIIKAMKNQAKYGWHLSNLVAFIRLNIFVKIELQKWLDQPFEDPPSKILNPKQGVLF